MTTRTLVLVCSLTVCLVELAVANEGPVLISARGSATTKLDGLPLRATEPSVRPAAPEQKPHQVFSDQVRARVDVAEAMRQRRIVPGNRANTRPSSANSPLRQQAPSRQVTPPVDLDGFFPPLPKAPGIDQPEGESARSAEEGIELEVVSEPVIQSLADTPTSGETMDEAGLDEEQVDDEVELPAGVAILRDRVRRVLDFHYERPLDAGRNDVWEVMHSFLAYGVDGRVRTTQYREPVNAIGWVCWNRPCKSKQLFQLRGGKLEAKQGPGVQGHHGQFLAMLAQCFVAPEYAIHVDGKTFTVEDLIQFEKETCVPKTELTFKLIALCYYLPMDATWRARDGREWNLELLLQEELAQNVIGAACGGTHRLAGIGLAVKKRKESGLPMDGTWAKAEEYIERYHKYTFSLQNRDGSFSTGWFEGRGMDPSIERRLQTTGHILEYLLLTCDDEMLADPRIWRAVDYLTKLLESNPRRNWSIGPQGHGLHALAIFDRRVFGTEPGHRNRAQQFASKEQESPR